jgi:putative ABC transport system permease protein
MDRLVQDFRIAVRSLLRHRTFGLVAIVTLALGVGATTAMFSVVYGVLLAPLPYQDAHQLVTLGQTSKSDPTEPVDGSSSHVNFLDWQPQSRTIPLMAMYSNGNAVVSHEGEAEVVPIGTVTPGFFAVFRAVPIAGREFVAEENRPTGPRAVVISYGYWQERYGGRGDVLSQSVDIGGVPWPIVGVAPRGFDFPNRARLWMPVRNNDQQCGRGCVYLNAIGRLAGGVTVEAAQQEMTAIAAALEREYPEANTDTTVVVQTLHERTVGNVRLALLVLLGAVVMVLLIACANVGNLVLVRGAARQGEIAVRTALGAGRRGVLSFLLTENTVLALAGGVLGLGLARWGIDALKIAAPDNLPRLDNVTLDLASLGFALFVVALTVIAFGVGPAVQLSRVPPAQALGQRGSIGSGRGRRMRSLLVVAEVALSLVLLLGAGLLLRSLSALQRTDVGFDPEGLTVFMLSLPQARYPAAQVIQTHEQLDQELRALPGVTAVARVSGLPLGVSENVLSFTRPDLPPPPPGQSPVALYRVVDAEYFATVQTPVLAGRAFEPTDRQDSPRVVVISKRMADTFWPGENPVGRPIQIGGQPQATVVGVVGNVRSQSLARPADPEMYVPHAQTSVRSVMYVVRSSLPAPQVLNAAREVVRRLDRRLPLMFPGSMRELVDEQLARPRFYLVLMGLFAVLAGVLAAVGLYGVVGYVVAQRTREIGVRVALGATRQQVVALVVWQGVRPAVVGIVLGLAATVALGRVVRGLLHEVQPHDPATLAAVSVLLLVIVLAACAIPARRASTLAPVDALRTE